MFNVVFLGKSQNSQQSPNHPFFPIIMPINIPIMYVPMMVYDCLIDIHLIFHRPALWGSMIPLINHSSEVEMWGRCNLPSLLVNVGETVSSYSNHVNWWFISPALFCKNIPSCFPDIDVHDIFLFQSWLSHRHQPSGLRCSRCAGPRLGRTGTAWSHVAATAWLQRCCVLRPEVQRKFWVNMIWPLKIAKNGKKLQTW